MERPATKDNHFPAPPSRASRVGAKETGANKATHQTPFYGGKKSRLFGPTPEEAGPRQEAADASRSRCAQQGCLEWVSQRQPGAAGILAREAARRLSRAPSAAVAPERSGEGPGLGGAC